MSFVEQIFVGLFTAGFFRLLGIVLLFPAPETVVGVHHRLGIALALVYGLFDPFQQSQESFSFFTPVFDLIFGMLLVTPLLAVFHGLRMWGDLFESARGHQMGLMIDPLSGGEEQPFALLLNSAVFFLIILEFLLPSFFVSFLRSLELLPPQMLTLSNLCSKAQLLLLAGESILTAFFALILPLTVFIVIVEVVALLVSKLCSGVSFTHESYILRFLILFGLFTFDSQRLIASFVAIAHAATGIG